MLLAITEMSDWITLLICPDDENRLKDTLKSLVGRLPVDNKYLLQVVMKCLKRIVDNSNVNKMTVSNISIIFGMSQGAFIAILSIHDIFLFNYRTQYNETEECTPCRS